MTKKEGWKIAEGLAKWSSFLLIICVVAIVATAIALMWRGGLFDEPSYQDIQMREYRRGVIGEFWFYIKLSGLVVLALGFVVSILAGARAIWMTANKAGHIRARGGLYPIVPRKTIMMVREPGDAVARPRVITLLYDPNRNVAPMAVVDGRVISFQGQEGMDSGQLALGKASLAVQQVAAATQDGFDFIDVNVGSDQAKPAGGGTPTLTPLSTEDIGRLLKDEGL